MMNIVGWFVAALLVVVTIGIHYEIMRIVSDVVLPWSFKRFHDRRAMMAMILTLLLGHIIEIWVFAVAIFLVSQDPRLGSLSGNVDASFNTYVYFSAVNYTSTGYGDITPQGIIRSIAVSEALAGLMMIAWSASFTYLKMEQIWQLHHRPQASTKVKSSAMDTR